MADNLEFETVKARILIMSQYFPEYSDALNKSLNYAKEDPSAGLLKSRQVLEEVCKTIWSKYESTPPPSIFDIFNTLLSLFFYLEKFPLIFISFAFVATLI